MSAVLRVALRVNLPSGVDPAAVITASCDGDGVVTLGDKTLYSGDTVVWTWENTGLPGTGNAMPAITCYGVADGCSQGSDTKSYTDIDETVTPNVYRYNLLINLAAGMGP